MGASDELVEWVDADGTVIEVVTRARMRAEKLRHRCVYIAVIRPGETDARAEAVMAHKRADWKDVYPGAWDLAFGGVCDPGETWIEAARRELAEEAGVALDADAFDDAGEVTYEEPGEVALIGRVFVVRYDGPFAPADGEVTELRWLPLSEVPSFVEAHEVPADSLAVVAPVLTQL